MKCLVLGLDALEYDFVNKFNLNNIKQIEYGKVIIPKDCYARVNTDYHEDNLSEPQTPRVWFSFITGLLPSNIGFRPLKWKNKTLNRIYNSYSSIPYLNGVSKKIFKRLDFKEERSEIQDYAVKTIFDFDKNHYALNVPLVTKDWWGWGYNLDPKDFTDLSSFIDKVLQIQLEKFNEQKEETLNFLEKSHNWNLFMGYYYVLDPYGELCFKKPDILKKMYKEIDEFINQINQRVDDTLILIVSDHGIEQLDKTPFGKHSDHAFYSTNMRLGLDKPKITDFYDIIKNVLSW
jgi:hypothetical protein